MSQRVLVAAAEAQYMQWLRITTGLLHRGMLLLLQ
jgi:hypothetical protein